MACGCRVDDGDECLLEAVIGGQLCLPTKAWVAPTTVANRSSNAREEAIVGLIAEVRDVDKGCDGSNSPQATKHRMSYTKLQSEMRHPPFILLQGSS